MNHLSVICEIFQNVVLTKKASSPIQMYELNTTLEWERPGQMYWGRSRAEGKK